MILNKIILIYKLLNNINIELSDLYNLSFKHIIKSYDKKIKTNEDF